MKPKRILLLCATLRGASFARHLFRLHPQAEYTLVTFRPETWEPDYLPSVEAASVEMGARLVLSKRIELDGLYADGNYDVLLAVNWRYLVPREVWSRARLGAYVFHDSLLPRYRGFSPTVWAMINGETATGVSLVEMTDPVDAGRLIEQEQVEIGPTEFVGSVMERVTAAYLRVLERTIEPMLAGVLPGRVQEEGKATYGCKRLPEDNRIDWREPAGRIFNLVRACSAPYSGAFGFWGGRKVVVWSSDPPASQPVYAGRIAGGIVEIVPGHGVRVLAGEGSLLLREVQVEDGPKTRADLVLNRLAVRLT